MPLTIRNLRDNIHSIQNILNKDQFLGFLVYFRIEQRLREQTHFLTVSLAVSSGAWITVLSENGRR